MYSPDFQNFNQNQLLLSSDRITLYSKKDSVFILGSQAVSLSSKKTINLDAVEKVVVYAPKIELGENATHPLVWGDQLNSQLLFLLDSLMVASKKMYNVSGQEKEIMNSMEKIKGAGQIIFESCERLKILLSPNSPSDSIILSKNNFTS